MKSYGDSKAFIDHCERELKRLQIRLAATPGPQARKELQGQIERRKAFIRYAKKHCSNLDPDREYCAEGFAE